MHGRAENKPLMRMTVLRSVLLFNLIPDSMIEIFSIGRWPPSRCDYCVIESRNAPEAHAVVALG